MNNLFSIFDPQTHSSLFLNWLAAITCLFLLPSIFWKNRSNTASSINFVLNYVEAEYKAIFGVTASMGVSFFPVSIFSFIALNNMLGLTPYIFTATAHLTLAFSLALPLWVGHVLYAWVLLPNEILAHLVPLGTPPALMPFMVLIELVRNLIRPLTLSVRLAANIVAGHLLLTLLSSQAVWVAPAPLVILAMCLILLRTLEMAVALIQAYVFRVLSALYVRDVNSKSFN